MTYDLSTLQITTIITLVIWDLIWKGIALWHAAQRHQRNWFIALLVINSAGILPIAYLLMERRVDKAYEIEFDLQF